MLPRVIRLPHGRRAGAEYDFVFLSSILHAHVGELFSGMNVLGCYQFRVTRNCDLFVDEEEIKNLRTALQGELPQRHFGDAVRLEVADNCSQQMTRVPAAAVRPAEATTSTASTGPVNLVRLHEVPDQVDRARPQVPGVPARRCRRRWRSGRDIFEAIRKGDVLLHHPFQSFTPVIEFIRRRRATRSVIAIKQTVYRTGTDSELMEIAHRRGAQRARKSRWWWS